MEKKWRKLKRDGEQRKWKVEEENHELDQKYLQKGNAQGHDLIYI